MKSKLIFIMIGILCMGIFVTGVTTITDESTTTPDLIWGQNSGTTGNAPTRNFVTSIARNLTVCAAGCDYTTIQAAMNDIPLIIRHHQEILVQDGDYPENVWVPTVMVGDIIDSTEGSVQGLRITGENMNNVNVSSFHISSSLGALTPTIRNFTMIGVDPYSDENISIVAYGAQDTIVKDINFSHATARGGILCYSCRMTVTNIYLGTDRLTTGVMVKHGGFVLSLDGGIHGTVLDYVYTPNGGLFITRNDTASGGLGYLAQNSGSPTTGFLFQHNASDIKKLYGVNQFDQLITELKFNTGGGTTPVKYIRTTSETERGDIYVDDNFFIFQSIQDEANGGGFQFLLDNNQGSGRSFEVLNSDSTVMLEVEPDASTTNFLPAGASGDKYMLRFTSGRASVGYDGSGLALNASTSRGIRFSTDGMLSMTMHPDGNLTLHADNYTSGNMGYACFDNTGRLVKSAVACA